MPDGELDLNDNLDDNDSDAGDSGSDNSAPPSGKAEPEADKKRVNDLMSKWQAEEARANKAEAELKTLKAGGAAAPEGSAPAGGADSTSEFSEFVREDARRRLFESEPKFAAYGLDQSAISGSTLAEMKESIKRNKALIEGMESRVRGAVLQEHGLDPEVVAGSHEAAPKLAEMSDSDFAAFLEKRDAHKFG